MSGIVRGSKPTGLLAAGVLATALATGWSAASPPPHEATVDSCYAFSVGALERHIKVTTVPPACAGLSHAEVNLAVARAVRTLVGPRPKAAARRQAIKESTYLARLITTVPPPKPVTLASPPRPAQSSTLPISLAALAAWIATAAAGGSLMAGWLARGGLRRRRTEGAGMPPAIIFSHFGLAVAGLAVWIAYVATNIKALAWVAVGVILPVAGLGMATLIAALPEPEPVAASAVGTRPGGALSGNTGPGNTGPGNTGPANTGSANTGSANTGSGTAGPRATGPGTTGPGTTGPGTTGTGTTGTGSAGLASAETAVSAPLLATRLAETTAPAAGRTPVILIAVHGTLATSAILLVILAAVLAA